MPTEGHMIIKQVSGWVLNVLEQLFMKGKRNMEAKSEG